MKKIKILPSICLVGLFSSCGNNVVPQVNTEISYEKVSLSKFSIVYNKENDFSAKSVAYEFQKDIKTKFNLTLPIIESDSELNDHSINVGFINKDELNKESINIIKNDKSISLYASENYGLLQACRRITKKFKADDALNSFKDGIVLNAYKLPEPFSIMSYNVRTSSPKDATLYDGSSGTISNRLPRVLSVINKYKPDVFGVQEAQDDWRTGLTNDLFPKYGYVGLGRETNLKGERSGIFYNKDKVNLIDSGTRWFSTTPDVPGSHYSNYGGYNRIYTYAIFQRHCDLQYFMMVNSHYDLTKAPNLQNATDLLEFTKSYSEKMPVLSTGDYNCSIGLPKYDGWGLDYYISNGVKNSIEDIKNPVNHFTYPSDGYLKPGAEPQETLDYILNFNNSVLFNSYEVFTDKVKAGNDSVAAPTSDHYPIYATGYFYEPFEGFAEFIPQSRKVGIDNSFVHFNSKYEELSRVSSYTNSLTIKAAVDDTNVAYPSTAQKKFNNEVGPSFGAIGNLSSTNSYFEYKFNSESEGKCDLDLILSPSNGVNSLNSTVNNLSTYNKIFINGNQVNLDSIKLKVNDINQWYEWNQLVFLDFNLVKGENTLRIETQIGKTAMPNQLLLEVFSNCNLSK